MRGKILGYNRLPISEPSLEHQGQNSRLNRDLNAQLTEHKTEEHHEERVGTNKLWAFILCFLNREPGHATTLKSPNWSIV